MPHEFGHHEDHRQLNPDELQAVLRRLGGEDQVCFRREMPTVEDVAEAIVEAGVR